MKIFSLALLIYLTNPMCYIETTTLDCSYTSTYGKTYKFKRKIDIKFNAENIYPDDFSRLDILLCDTAGEIDYEDWTTS